METSLITPTEIRDLIELAGYSVHDERWDVEYVVIRGMRISPNDEHGYLNVNGERTYSSAWA